MLYYWFTRLDFTKMCIFPNTRICLVYRNWLHRKKYALTKKLEKGMKEVSKRKIDCGDADCPNPREGPDNHEGPQLRSTVLLVPQAQ